MINQSKNIDREVGYVCFLFLCPAMQKQLRKGLGLLYNESTNQ